MDLEEAAGRREPPRRFLVFSGRNQAAQEGPRVIVIIGIRKSTRRARSTRVRSLTRLSVPMIVGPLELPPEDSEPVGGLVVLGQAALAGERGGTDGVRLAVGVDVLQGLGGGQDVSLVRASWMGSTLSRDPPGRTPAWFRPSMRRRIQ